MTISRDLANIVPTIATSSGNVGIGTSSPGQKLDVQMSSSSGSSFPVMSVSNTLATQGNNTSTYNYARVDIKSGNGTVHGDIGTRYDTTFSGMYLGTETNHGMFFQTLGTERMRINSDGTIKTSSTISVGGATPSTSGAGITFPATQSASSDANTLDDYEEGTWTPTFRGAGTAGTYTLSGTIATYTKVGRMVCISAYFTFSAASGGSSYAVIEGMPFNIGSVSVATPYLENVDLSATNKYVTLSRVSGATNTRLYFAETVDNGAAIALAVSAFTTSSTVQFSLVYEAA